MLCATRFGPARSWSSATAATTRLLRLPITRRKSGNALQIYPTTNTANFVRYYMEPVEEQLKRVVSGSSNIQVVANFVTNDLAFAVEDFRGNTQTQNRNNRVIRLNLDFFQWEYPLATAGSGGMYDYYHLQTRISRRTIE